MRHPWKRVLDAAVSGLLVGLLAAGPALAQQPPLSLVPRVLPGAAGPKLTVVVVPLDAAAQSQVPRLLAQAEQAVVSTGRFEVVRLVDALDAQGARAREQKAQEADAAFQEGQKAYDELDTQKALERFDTAAKTYEGSDLTRHFADMSRSRVMKIASYVANGDEKEAAQQIKDVLARNPRAEFSPNYFPPEQLALVEKTRKAVLAEADRALEVSTGKVSAQVFLDGQFQGTSPLKLSGLSRADHYVTAIAPGYALAQEWVSGDKEKVELNLRPVPTAQRWQSLVERIEDEPEGEDRDEALRELGALAGTQQVLALLVRAAPGPGARDAIALRLELSDGHNAGYATGPVPSSGEAMDPAIQSLLAQALETDAPRAGGPVTHFSTTGPSPGKRTAGYVLMATGVALVAGGVYFGLQASSKADSFKKAPQNSPRAEQLRSDGKTFALIADVGIIAGLASAGAGTWLAFLSGKGGSKQQPAPSRVPARTTEPTPQPTPVVPTPAPQAKPEPTPQGKPPASTRADERRAREEAAKAEAEEKRKRQEAEAEEKRKREEAAKAEAEEKRKRQDAAKAEAEEKRKSQEASKAEAEEKRKREEAAKAEQDDKRKREEEARLKKEQEDKRKREEEERRKLEEEKKKRPPLDEDDLRNY